MNDWFSYPEPLPRGLSLGLPLTPGQINQVNLTGDGMVMLNALDFLRLLTQRISQALKHTYISMS